MTTLSFSDLPGQTHFSSALASRDPWLHSRLKGSERDREPSAEKRLSAVDLIRKSMSDLSLSSAQGTALDCIEKGTRVIVTGQQVGFLGGPLYTLYKIATALSKVREYTLAGRSAVAVFWIEDNDHDAVEAGLAYGYTKEQGVVNWSCTPPALDKKVPVAERQFTEEIAELIDMISQGFTQGEFGEHTKELLTSTYTAGTSWTSAFVHLLQSWFSDSGLLFVSGALARRLQKMTPVIQRELENPGRLQAAVNQANFDLESHGFHSQAKASEFNLFFHRNGQRLKLHRDEDSGHILIGEDRLQQQELMQLFADEPQNFSPSVLLRPIVQDDILGTAEYVAGPSEAAYIAQLNSAYEFFDVPMPRVVLRSGATLINKRIQRFLEKEELEIGFFLRPWEEIEAELVASIQNQEITSLLDTTGNSMLQLLESLRTPISQVDKTLDASISAAWKAIDKEFGTLRKKVNSASKRREEEKIAKFREVNAFLYPLGELQERKLSPIFVSSEGGRSAVQHIIEVIASQPASQHFVVNI